MTSTQATPITEERIRYQLERFREGGVWNLTVINLPSEATTALEKMAQRTMQLQCTIQDGQIWLTDGVETVQVERIEIEEHHPVPVLIEPVIADVPKSERVAKERQKPLFTELPDSKLPQVDLLDAAGGRQETVSAETLEMTSRMIEKKLKDFGVEVRVVLASPGPVITRYEIEPATGVKGSQIVNLAKDLARSLSLVSIRVIETIPGKNYMALELPNAKRQSIRLSEILGSQVYNEAKSMLTMGLGKDIVGNPVVADLAKMPHVLVAGTTGAGDIADAMADVDYNVGLVLDAIERLGLSSNTIVFWCTDNGAEQRRPWRADVRADADVVLTMRIELRRAAQHETGQRRQPFLRHRFTVGDERLQRPLAHELHVAVVDPQRRLERARREHGRARARQLEADRLRHRERREAPVEQRRVLGRANTPRERARSTAARLPARADQRLRANPRPCSTFATCSKTSKKSHCLLKNAGRSKAG